jgi:hypothetical protein
MSETPATYRVRVRGLWAERHELWLDGARYGELTIGRNRWGQIVAGTWRPVRGELLQLRRDPGLLRSQFSLWTENREWLGSALRPRGLRREVELSTPSKALRLVPTERLGRGWRLVAPRTGELARYEAHGPGRGATIRVGRRVETELVLFGYFLARLSWAESLLPGPSVAEDPQSLPSAASKA